MHRLPWLALLVLFVSACGGGGDPTPNPNPNACEGITSVCSSAADCAEGATCDDCGRCVGGGCSGDADCAEGEVCDGGTCVASRCTDDASCGPGKRCDDGTCVITDCTLAGCPDPLTCRTSDKTCVECVVNADCNESGKPFCQVDTGLCLACRGDGDCDGNPNGERCNDAWQCVQCLSDTDCGDRNAPKCKVDAGICGKCNADSDCPNGSVCRDDATCDLGPEDGEPCTAAGTCAPGFACAGQTCRTECDLYEPECPTGRVCGLIARDGRAVMKNNGEPVAACVETGTGAGPGIACNDSTPCRADLFCVPDSTNGGECRRFCAPGSADVCSVGDVCVPIPIGEGGEAVGVCSSDDTWLTACSTDADCDTGLGCMPFLEDDLLVGRCQFSDGTGEALAACTDDADCRSDFCLPMQQNSTAGFCFGACETDTDCGTEGLCVEYTFNVGNGGTATMNGCRASCLSDADCEVFGDETVCTLGVQDQQLVGLCAAREGTRDGGDSCTADDMCGTGLCFDNGAIGRPADAGFCLGTCQADVDCGPDTACRAAALNVGTAANPVFDSAQICWGYDCDTHADCPAGWACDVDTDPADPANRLRTSCYPAQGPGMAGSSCEVSACATNICFPFESSGLPYENCTNGTDDDFDFLPDCSDPDCSGTAACAGAAAEVCTGGVDEDGDGLVDCLDPDCRHTAACVENCTNGVDDDGDGNVDCADGQCAFDTACASDVCWGPCETDDDCAEGTECAFVTFTGSTSLISACLPR